MEALGAAASVAGLISLAVQVPKLIDIAASIRSAPEEALQLSKTVDALVFTLKQLEEFLKTDEAREMTLSHDSALIVAISACQSRVLDLSKKLRSHQAPGADSGQGKVKGAISRFRWPFDKKQCLELVAEMHAMQSTFKFSLVMKNCQQMSKSHKEVISYFKLQSDTLAQMAATFPEQAASLEGMVEQLRVVGSCVSDSAERLDRLQLGLTQLGVMNKELLEYHMDELHGQALEWLSPLDPSSRHEEVRASRHPGTCEWIIRDSCFQRWLRTPRSDTYPGVVCWIGDPGQGKTFTLSRVLDHLQDKHGSETGTYVTYLYCDYQRTRDYSHVALVGALVRQLLAQFPSLPDDVAELVRLSHIKLRRPNATMEDMYRVLEHLVPQVKRLLVCIDALDECKEAERLVESCRRLPLATSLLFLGRQSITTTVKRAFPDVEVRTVQPQRADIHAVISERVERESARQPELISDALAHEIREGISTMANGMFLLASLHTTLVLSHNTIYRRREALKNLPKTLEAAFGQTLQRIREDAHANQALRILGWVHFAGTLSLDEVRHAIAVDHDHEKFEQDNLPSSTTLLDCCLGLVRLDRGLWPSLDNSRVTLAHSTLSTYFDSHPALLEGIIPSLAGSCLAYLMFKREHRPAIILPLMRDLWRELLRRCKSVDDWLGDLVWRYCLALNAEINNKFAHWRQFVDEGAEAQGAAAVQAVNPPLAILPTQARVLWSYRISQQFKSGRLEGQSLVHTVCMLELDTLDPVLSSLRHNTEHLDDASINKLDCFGISPLGWTLVSRGQFDNYVDNYRITKSYAVRAAHDRVGTLEDSLVRLENLVANIPQLKPSQHLWDLYTLETIRNRCLTFTDQGVSIQHFTSSLFLFLLHHNNPVLPEATRRSILNILNHQDINIWHSLRQEPANRKPTPGGDPEWDLAVSNNREELVSAGARDRLDRFKSLEYTIRTVRDNDVLKQYTSIGWEGREFAALFETGNAAPSVISEAWLQDRFRKYATTWREISISSHSLFHGTSCWNIHLPQQALLHVAAAGGSDDIASFALRQCGVDPNIRDPDGHTALQVALMNQSEVAAILIEYRSIDLGVRASDGGSLLHLCIQHGLLAEAAQILKKRPDIVDFRDMIEKTALHYAADIKSKDFVRLFLRHMADSNMEDENGDTPLHVAIKNGDAVLCSLFLERPPKCGLSPRNLDRAWHLAVDTGAKFIMMVLKALRENPQMPLLEGGAPSSAEASKNGNMLQVYLQVGEGSGITEKDLDFMLNLNKNAATQPSSAIVSSGGNSSTALIDSSTMLYDAITKGAENVAVFIWHKSTINVNYTGPDGDSLLHLAIIQDARDIVGLLLRHKDTDISALYRAEYTPLQLAIIYQRPHIIELLLGCQRTDASVVTKGGKTLLHLAITHNMLDSIPLLLSNPQTPINTLDGSGRAAIHYAATQKTTTVAKILLESPGVDLTKLSSDGRTALAYAAPCAREDMISLLLETRKFSTGQTDSYGKTVLDWARMMNPSQSVMARLQEARVANGE